MKIIHDFVSSALKTDCVTSRDSSWTRVTMAAKNEDKSLMTEAIDATGVLFRPTMSLCTVIVAIIFLLIRRERSEIYRRGTVFSVSFF